MAMIPWSIWVSDNIQSFLVLWAGADVWKETTHQERIFGHMILIYGKRKVSVIFDNGVYRSSSSVYCATNDSQFLFYNSSTLLEVK